MNTYGYVGGNPLFYVDPIGLAMWGFFAGGSGGFSGMTGGISVTVGLDSNGSLLVLYTPEAGAGTPGLGGFARGVGGAGTVDDLLGAGVSVSGGLYGITGSATLPLSLNTEENCFGELQSELNSGTPVYELGIGTPGISVTAGSGEEIFRTEVLGDIGRWIGEKMFDLHQLSKRLQEMTF